ncbi:hypothetical protein H6G74_17260 [Nostoc spongiaeforme FACHB-130]|uniref:Uncharacterized protein n=1 Tax=Nostoc spongiaeforme FACHB-130 TaxID=1357510 RepID=A0ABR8FXL1_9NOSO|nr:hypothetical protein [Nostoc spongiaeforme]MBD2596061.1 hypothetical protein [Nostoc spongiaeforme FACHB-130]
MGIQEGKKNGHDACGGSSDRLPSYTCTRGLVKVRKDSDRLSRCQYKRV